MRIPHDKHNKYQPEQEQSSETKKRRHSTDHDEESMSTREDRSVKVKVKVTVEPPNPANVAEFNQEFQDIHLDQGRCCKTTRRDSAVTHGVHGEVAHGSKGGTQGPARK